MKFGIASSLHFTAKDGTGGCVFTLYIQQYTILPVLYMYHDHYGAGCFSGIMVHLIFIIANLLYVLAPEQ